MSFVPCRCDRCGEVEEHGTPGAEHWRTIEGASWSKVVRVPFSQIGPTGSRLRRTIEHGTILRRCRKRGTLRPLDTAATPTVA